MAQLKHQFTLATLATATLLAAGFLAGCGPEASAVGAADRTFAVSGPVRLELENGSGDSRVTVGAPGEVRVHAEFRVHAWPWDDPDRTLKNLVANPPFSQEDSLIRIGHSGWDMNMVSADYSVTVPPDTQMRGMAGSGNLDVNGIAGPANFIVGSGNISATAIANDTHAIVGSGNVTLSDTQGRVDVTSGSGNLVVRGAKDEIRARAGSGEIRIEQPAGNVVADAGSGNIELRGATADVRLHTGSGEINVEGNPAPSSFWDIRASSGDVELHVPSSASFRFYARSSSGDINVSAPSVTEQTHGKHDFQARIGDGKARVEIETSSGTISVH
jgi:Putative adhesin